MLLRVIFHAELAIQRRLHMLKRGGSHIRSCRSRSSLCCWHHPQWRCSWITISFVPPGWWWYTKIGLLRTLANWQWRRAIVINLGRWQWRRRTLTRNYCLQRWRCVIYHSRRRSRRQQVRWCRKRRRWQLIIRYYDMWMLWRWRQLYWRVHHCYDLCMAMARRLRLRLGRRRVKFKVVVTGIAAAEAEIAVDDARWACRHAECANNKLMSCLLARLVNVRTRYLFDLF